MSALGHKRTFAVQNVMSALPPKADRRLCVAALRQRGPIRRRVTQPPLSLAAMIARQALVALLQPRLEIVGGDGAIDEADTKFARHGHARSSVEESGGSNHYAVTTDVKRVRYRVGSAGAANAPAAFEFWSHLRIRSFVGRMPRNKKPGI